MTIKPLNPTNYPGNQTDCELVFHLLWKLSVYKQTWRRAKAIHKNPIARINVGNLSFTSMLRPTFLHVAT